jgi:hypothetical protein
VTPIATATDTAGAPITVGIAPSAIAITPDSKTAYVVDIDPHTVTPIATAINIPGSPTTVGLTPRGITITPDGKTAYVPTMAQTRLPRLRPPPPRRAADPGRNPPRCCSCPVTDCTFLPPDCACACLAGAVAAVHGYDAARAVGRVQG